jgi:hypothetical protein
MMRVDISGELQRMLPSIGRVFRAAVEGAGLCDMTCMLDAHR